MNSCHRSRVSTISEAITARSAAFFTSAIREIGFDGSIADEFDVVEPDHARSPEIERRITRLRHSLSDADGFSIPLLPTGFERAVA